MPRYCISSVLRIFSWYSFSFIRLLLYPCYRWNELVSSSYKSYSTCGISYIEWRSYSRLWKTIYLFIKTCYCLSVNLVRVFFDNADSTVDRNYSIPWYPSIIINNKSSFNSVNNIDRTSTTTSSAKLRKESKFKFAKIGKRKDVSLNSGNRLNIGKCVRINADSSAMTNFSKIKEEWFPINTGSSTICNNSVLILLWRMEALQNIDIYKYRESVKVE